MSTFKVLILKSGPFSLHPAWGPRAILEEGKQEQFDKDTCQRLVDAEWAQWSEVDTEEDVEMEDEDIEKDPKDILYGLIEGKEESEQKEILQDWGIAKTGDKISKAKSVENMIFEICQNIKK